jgi:hypothetical protein
MSSSADWGLYNWLMLEWYNVFCTICILGENLPVFADLIYTLSRKPDISISQITLSSGKAEIPRVWPMLTVVTSDL